MPPDPQPQPQVPRQFDPTRDEIVDALRQTGGRMRPAAQLLNVDRRKLYRLCERIGFIIEDYHPVELPREDE